MKLIKFTSPTCAPCKALAPVVDQVCTDLELELVEASDVDFSTYKIRTVPTLLLVDEDNEVVSSFVGMKTYTQLLNGIQSYVQ